MTTVTYAGDSITNPENSFSWTRFLTGTALRLVNGVGISGATSAAVRNAVAPVDADVLVVMVGTNDIRLGVGRSTIRDNIAAIVEVVGADHVVIGQVAPSNLTDYGADHIDRAAGGFAHNRDLARFAADRGWLLVDPWFPVRRLDGTYASGAADSDGVHPTVATGTTAGAILSAAIRIAAGGASA